MIGRFIYRNDLFEAGTIRRMIGHWRMLLEGIAAARPRSKQQLRGIPGIGDKKLERYGDALMEIVLADTGD